MMGGLLAALAPSPSMRAALRYSAIVLAVLLFLLSLRRSGERTGRLAERFEITEKANDIQCRMPDAGCRMPDAGCWRRRLVVRESPTSGLTGF